MSARLAALTEHIAGPMSTEAVSCATTNAQTVDSLVDTCLLANGTAQIVLNRPKALNALVPEMMRTIHSWLSRCAKDPTVKAVVVEGTGRAFCAGGDLKRLLQETDGCRDYISTEYRMDARVHYLRKPIVALWHGIIMGGGAGLTANGSYRIATEHTVFAMPEVKAGFFPDVGCSHFLSRCPDGVGMYLALTGDSIRGADVLHARLATHFVPAAKLPLLRERLLQGDLRAGVLAIIEQFAERPAIDDCVLVKHEATIRRCFGQSNSVEQTLQRLQQEQSDWSSAVGASIRARCPLSVKISFEMLRRSQSLPFADCIRMEFRIAMRILADPFNVREGVRAVLVDRDNKPKWLPATVEEVTDAQVERHLAPFSDVSLELHLDDLLNEQ